MPSLERTCPDCGQKVFWNFGQTILGERLGWHASLYCDHCGYALEQDDVGPLPQDLRRIVLAEQGQWALLVEGTNDQTPLFLKSLREALSLSLPQVAQLRKLIPGIVLSGTRAEMERLHIILSRH